MGGSPLRSPDMDTVDLPRIEALRNCLDAERDARKEEGERRQRTIEGLRREVARLKQRIRELEGGEP